jgi:outer membrane lipoprotein SlyB
MKMHQHIFMSLTAGALLVATGCATLDSGYRGMTKVTNPDKMTLTGGIQWKIPPLEMGLRPVSQDRQLAYLRVKNTSGTDLPNLYENIKASLEGAGYRFTDDPAQAQFQVFADTSHFGINTRNDAGMGVLAGGALGGIAGAVLGHNVGNGNRNIGAVAGAAVGAGTAQIFGNRNKMIEYNLVVDIRVGERLSGISTTRQGTTTRASGDAQSASTQESFLFHSNRIVAHATKMGLGPEEALPFLSHKLISAISNLLP